jgi:hypothetical protein
MASPSLSDLSQLPPAFALRPFVCVGAMGGPLPAASLDFSVGLRFQDWILHRFNRPVNLLPGTFNRHEFFLVVSFGRCCSRLCEESVGLLLQSFIGGSAKLFRTLQLSDRVFRFSLSCKEVGFAVYRRHSFNCSSFKAYLHLWNYGGPNWIKEWQLFSDEESCSWTLVSRGCTQKASFADIVRSPVLSGANLVPLGGLVGAGRLQPRFSVFNRISFPARHRVDQPATRSYSHEQIARRTSFQNHSNLSSGHIVRPNLWYSLRSSRARPWASWKLIWRPKKILNRRQDTVMNKSALSINAASATVSDDSHSNRTNSFLGNICQIFGFPRQNCKRDFLTFPSKFADVA